ncbi:hypothetical protein GCM10028787_31660 [Brachybacterium horti]
MSDIIITVQNDATGSITIDGTPHALQASTVAATRDQAMGRAKTHARTTGRAVNVTANDPTGTFHLAIQPDGTITTQPAPEPAAWEQPSTEPTITEVPATQAPVIEDSSPRQHDSTLAPAPKGAPSHAEPTWTPQPAPTAPSEATSAPVSQPTPEPVSAAPMASTPDPIENDPRWADISQQPATQGFRGTLNGMGLKLSPADDELAERREALRQEIAREEQARIVDEQRAQEEAAQETRRAAREREAAEKDRAERMIIQTPLEEPKHVLIANDKGGQGKTSGTYCIAATAGRIRGGDVIAWDANETRGNLGFRSRKATTSRSVVDLLEDAVEDFTTVEGSKRSTLAKFTRSQGDNLFSVLASDENPENQDLVDADAFEKVNEILGRFYSLILVDTGNNHRVSHFRAALAAADQLVIPVSAGADGAHAAETMLDTFESLGYHDLVKNAVVLLNDSATRRGNATGIAAKFEQRVRAIIPIPFDPALDSGDEISFEALQPATRAAYQEATAAIAHGLTLGESR